MEKEKLKLIIRNLELLVEALKSEVYSDTQSYLPDKSDTKFGFGFHGRDDDDGYPD